MSNPSRPGIRENFVYWLFDEDGDCLYVGMTRKPEQRWAAHRAEKPGMYAQIAYRRMAGPFELATARKLEREQQEDLTPIYDDFFGCPAERVARDERQEFLRMAESLKR